MGLSKHPQQRLKSLDNLRLGRGLRWRGNLAVPERCHPLVKQLYEIANNEMTTMTMIGDKANIRRSTISNWRVRCVPRIDLFEAALNVMGYELCIRRRKES